MIGVARRIDAAVRVRNRRIVEHAHHLEEGVHRAKIGDESGRPLLGRAGRKPGDVEKFDRGRRRLLRVIELGQPVEPRIGHEHAPPVHLTLAAEVAGLGLAPGQRVEQRGLPCPGQPDDPDLHSRLRP
jgi:hypothetical protein